MKWVRDPFGRLPERPHYDPEEIDRECESRVSAFLRRRHGEVRYPLATNDLAILVEQEASDLDLYADLASEGAGIEGVTEFVPGDRPRIRIARELSEDPSRERRLRTTLAHELGHVWFHAFLWGAPRGNLLGARHASGAMYRGHSESRRSSDFGLRTSDFGLGLGGQAHRGCGQGTILHARPTNWMEWQAGYASGAVLMPAGPLRRLVAQTQAAHAFRITLDTAAGAALLTQVERAFAVSREAARVRLAAGGLMPDQPRKVAPRVVRQRRAPVLGTR